MNSILPDQIPLQQLASSSFEIQTDPNAGSNPEISATTQETFDIDKFLETNNAFLNATEKFQKEQVTIKVLEQMLGHLLVRDAISSLTSLKNLKTLVDLMVKFEEKKVMKYQVFNFFYIHFSSPDTLTSSFVSFVKLGSNQIGPKIDMSAYASRTQTMG